MGKAYRRQGWAAAAFGLAVASLGRVGLAQTGPNLLVLPWDDGQAVDTRTEATFESSVRTREGSPSVQLNTYQTQGRWRLFPDAEATPRIGYDVLYFDVETQDPKLPRHLWDTSVGVAQPVAKFGPDEKWFAVVTAAAGYAGDSPASDSRAWYATGNVIVGRKFSDDRALVIALNYDGNRTFLPDSPVPGFAFKDRLNEHFTYVVGLPVNSLTYEPLNGVQIDAGWSLLTTFSARVGYEFLKHYSVYSSYTDRLTAFHVTSDLNRDSRLFLQEHRAEAGFRWNPTKLVRLSVGGGWAFGQEFAHGFDTRDLRPTRHLDDGPFARIYLEIGL